MHDDEQEQKVGIIGALFGLAIQPWETTQILLQRERPKYTLMFLILLIVTIFGPALVYLWQQGDQIYWPDRTFMHMWAFAIFITFYTTFQGLYFYILGFEFTFGQLLATVVYSLTPFIALFLVMYTFNYLATKNFQFMHFAAQGEYKVPLGYEKILPFLVIIVEVSMFFIITFSIKVLTEASNVSAMLYAGLSIGTFALAGVSTAMAVNSLIPGSKVQIYKILNYLATVWQNLSGSPSISLT